MFLSAFKSPSSKCLLILRLTSLHIASSRVCKNEQSRKFQVATTHTHTHTHTSLPSPLARHRLIPQGTHPVCPQQDRKTGLNLLSRPVPRHPHHPPGKRANKKTVPHLVQVPSTKLMNGKKLTARSFLSSSRLLCLSVARTPRIPFFCGFAFGIFAVF